MAVYYFYLARCKDNTLYAGYCANIKDREAKHNEGLGAKYTKYRRPIQIVYFEEFPTRSEAMKREAEIKTWSRLEKEKLIK
ncbi:GIY-YIG nuclease family protein [Patescibacteria group bacterium]|jgi:putative endonuclease|nr:GIY-YIG nuclease family protein [Patescibacteria group bacterium]